MCNTALIAIIKIELVWNSESQMHLSYTFIYVFLLLFYSFDLQLLRIPLEVHFNLQEAKIQPIMAF